MDNERVGTSEAEIEQDLAALRKGRALTDPTLRERLGPALWVTIGMPNSLPQGQVRALLTHRIRTAAQHLPPDLRLATDAMFGLTAEYRLPHLGDRQRLLAERTMCDPRTARRRCDAALRLLAEILALEGDRRTPEVGSAVNGTAAVTDNLYNREMRILVRLDLDRPEVREDRCIVALMSDVHQVLASTTLLTFHPEDDSGGLMRTEIDYGGVLVHDELLPGGRSLAVVRLPHALAHGEEHWYGRTVRAVSSREPAPRALFTPSVRCDRLSIHVRFRAGAAPPGVRWIDGVALGASPLPSSQPTMQVDAADEVRAVFTELQRGHSYGLMWNS